MNKRDKKELVFSRVRIGGSFVLVISGPLGVEIHCFRLEKHPREYSKWTDSLSIDSP